MLRQLFALVRKDLKMFVADRRSMIISFAVPIVLASGIGSLFGGASSGKTASKIEVLVVDNDHSDLTKGVIKRLNSSDNIKPIEYSEDAARQRVKSGASPVAIVFPKDFGKGVTSAITSGGKPVDVPMVFDPSHTIETQAIRGIVIQSIMREAGPRAYGQDPNNASTSAYSTPFNFKEEPQAQADQDVGKVALTHVFAGMAVQGVLFMSIELAMGIMRDRRLGLWKRIAAAPVRLSTILGSKLISGTGIGLTILCAVLLAGSILFGIKATGSMPGLVLVLLATGFFAAAFGLFVASIGKNEPQSRGLSVLIVLTLSMFGGAWFPTMLMPPWMQKVTMVLPTRYAIDGLDSMLWRGGDFSSILPQVGALVAFAVVVAAIALLRFRSLKEA